MAKHILNPKETMAILIGVEEYGSFSSIPAASNNVAAFAKVLQADSIFGLPKEQIHTITKGNSTVIKRVIRQLTTEAKSKGLKNLIFYFAGHGYRRADKSYYLVVNESERDDIEEDGETGMAYEFVKKHINKAHIERRIIFLDTCYSGLAAQSNSNDLGEAIQIKGSYTITSSNALEKSYFDTASEHTLFTEELLHIFRNGLPNKNEHISLAALYRALKTNVKKRQPKMTPLQRIGEEVVASDFFLFKNNKFDKEAIAVKELEDDITKGQGIKLIEEGKFKAAKRFFKGLLGEIEESIEKIDNKVYLENLLSEKIVDCENLMKYQPVLERIFNKSKNVSKLKKELNDTIQELEDVSHSYRILQRDFTDASNKHRELQDKIIKISAERDEFRDDYRTCIEELEEVSRSYRTLQRDFTDAYNKHRELQDRINILKAKDQQHGSELSEWKIRYFDAEDYYKKLEEENESLKLLIEGIKVDLLDIRTTLPQDVFEKLYAKNFGITEKDDRSVFERMKEMFK